MDEIEIPLNISLPKVFKQIDQIADYMTRRLGQAGSNVGILGVPSGLGNSGGGSSRGSSGATGGSGGTGGGGAGGRAPSSFFSRLGGAAMSSRFSLFGGRVQPLVGQTLKALGLSKGASGGAALGVAAIAGLAAAANAAAQAVMNLAQGAYATGGTMHESALLGGIGGALGMKSGSLANAGREIADRIFGDPIARMFAMKAGINDIGGPFGKVDKTENVLKAIQYIRTSSFSDAIRFARALGREDLLSSRLISNKTFGQIQGDTTVRSRIANPQYARMAAEYDAQVDRAAGAAANVNMKIAKITLPWFTRFMEGFANAANGAAQFGPGRPGTKGMFGMRYTDPDGKGQDATDRLVKSIDGLAVQMENQRNVIGLGAAFSGGAVPKGWRGGDAYDNRNVIKWGQFNVG